MLRVLVAMFLLVESVQTFHLVLVDDPITVSLPEWNEVPVPN